MHACLHALTFLDIGVVGAASDRRLNEGGVAVASPAVAALEGL